VSIEDTQVVDVTGRDRITGRVVLTISDHLPWSDEARHFDLLDQKIRAYVGFIESDQILQRYPDARERRAQIELVCKYPPTPGAVGFLDALRQALERRGIAFTHAVLSHEGEA
jgi:hypothetical protein